MEVEEIQSNGSRISRSSNGNVIRRRSDSIKVVPNDEDDGEQPKRRGSAAAAGRGGGVLGDAALMAGVNESGDGGRLREWHNSSRIIRVSRASGGKDRHSKVWTSRGLRDRRIRLSVNTAIEFYDLQDRLGYDQPSKAVEWLIEAAKDPIAELPSLNNSFPNTPNQLSNETISRPKGLDSVDAELDGEDFQQQQQPHHSLSKSACSSTSETSKVSGLSPSRTDPRVNREKARERARERASKEKEKDTDHNDSSHHHHHHHHHIVSPNASFTELLAGGIGTTNSTPMEYFNTGLLAPRPHHSSGFSGQIQLGGPLPAAAQSSSLVPASGFNVMAGENQPELQHFSLVPDHLIPVSSQPGGDYNLNFAISSGFNRGGTLQSNFSPLWPHIQRHSPTDVSNLPFFVGAPAPAPAVEPHHHHHQFPPGLDGGLQLSYGDGTRLSDHKGKGKN